MKHLTAYLLVAAGGALGAMARMAVASASRHLLGEQFPWGTMLINITGSFALGLLATVLATRTMAYSEPMRLGIAVGFLGAYTTFSTFELESSALASSGRWLSSLIYVLASVTAGFAAVRLGILLGRSN